MHSLIVISVKHRKCSLQSNESIFSRVSDRDAQLAQYSQSAITRRRSVSRYQITVSTAVAAANVQAVDNTCSVLHFLPLVQTQGNTGFSRVHFFIRLAAV